MFITHMPFDIFQWLRIFCIHNLRFCLNDIQESSESGQPFLHHFRKLYQNLDRTDKNANIKRIHCQICRLHLSMCNQPASKHQRHQIHHPLKEQIASCKTTHTTIICILWAQKTLIALFKFFPFNVFIRKRLYHTNSCQRILKAGIQISDLTSVIHKCCLHLLILSIRKKQHNCHNHQKRNCQFPVD